MKAEKLLGQFKAIRLERRELQKMLDKTYDDERKLIGVAAGDVNSTESLVKAIITVLKALDIK